MISEENDIYFLISGKALFIATEFESDFKALCNHMGIKKIPSNDTENFSNFVDKISQFQYPRELIKEYGLNKNEILRLALSEAINSRNYIAHDLIKGLECEDTDEFSIQEFLKNEITPHISNILKADFILKTAILILNKEDNSLNMNWIENRLKWVVRVKD